MVFYAKEQMASGMSMKAKSVRMLKHCVHHKMSLSDPNSMFCMSRKPCIMCVGNESLTSM